MLALLLSLPLASLDLFGLSACGLDDVDGDGTPDLAVGDPHDRPYGDPEESPGVVRIVSGADGALVRELRGTVAGERFGVSLANAGDLDGDGMADLLLGCARSGIEGRGSVRAITAAGATLYAVDVPADDWDQRRRLLGCGPAIAAVGDVDLDGDVDVAIGSAQDRERTAGTVRVLDGRTGALLLLITGEQRDDRFGTCVAAAGDVDLDGAADLAVGAAPRDPHGEPRAGYVTLISARKVERLLRIETEDGAATFGIAVASIEDRDGDGRRDLAIGVVEGLLGTQAAVHAHSSASGAPLYTWNAPEDSGLFGGAVLALPDVDADGTGDLLVGSPRAAGAAIAVSGRGGAWLWERPGDPWTQAGVGVLLAPAGDLDCDGLADVLIGGGTQRGDFPGVLYATSARDGRRLLELNRAAFVPRAVSAPR